MGLSLGFYAGDARIIGAAFTEIEFDELRNGSKAAAYADFSLHLDVFDIDKISDVISIYTGINSVYLTASLTDEVGSIDEGETGGANLVYRCWVEMIASLDSNDAGEIARDWIAGLGEAHGISLEVTEHPTRALSSLIKLCKKAIGDDLDVVYAWYL